MASTTQRSHSWLQAAAGCALIVLVAGSGCEGCSHPAETDDAQSNGNGTDDVISGDADNRDAPGSDTSSPPTTEAVDILWVIDNSGSMCEEQEALRQNFNAFVQDLAARQVDFQMGVTTTHLAPESLRDADLFESKHGQLQAQPQPVPSNYSPPTDDLGCGSDPEKFESAMRRAFDCTSDPQSFYDQYLPLSEGQKSCIRDAESSECQDFCEANQDARGCVQQGGRWRFERDALFPDSEDYADRDKVLDAEAYRNADGSIDKAALSTDFSCMSFVGTRGWSFEKGLGAAVYAVSPEVTGGAVDVENPEDPGAPNHGLLRKDARFATIFVTDENDCTYDVDPTDGVSGNDDAPPEYRIYETDSEIPEDSPQCGGEPCDHTCADDVCDFANSTALSPEEAPLIEPGELGRQLLENLSASKGRQVGPNEVVIASIHGRAQRYSGQWRSYPECAAPDYEPTEFTCNTEFGTTYSGDRYERFLEWFQNRGANDVFPDIADRETGTTHRMCNPDQFSQTLQNIGAAIAGSVSEQ